MNERERFLERRRAGIGSSDIPAIMGRDRFRTPLDIWRSKVESINDPPGPDARRGIALEDHAAAELALQTGRTLMTSGQIIHQDHLWARCNPDRIDADTGTVVEIKCPRGRVHGRWKAIGLPESIILQVQWQLEVTKAPDAEIFPFNGDTWSGYLVPQELDADIAEAMLQAADHFWNHNVLGDIPPDETEVAPMPEIPAPEGEITMIGGEKWEALASGIIDLQRAKNDAIADYNEAAELVKAQMEADGLEAIELPEVARIYWRHAKPGTTFDHKALEAAAPLDRLKVREAIAAIAGRATAGTPPGELGAEADSLLEHCGLDLATFRKPKKASRPFRVYDLNPLPKIEA